MLSQDGEYLYPQGRRPNNRLRLDNFMELRQKQMIQAEVFDGYPYLITQLSIDLYHLLLLPVIDWPGDLVILVGAQVRRNRLPACLVSGGEIGTYIEPESGHFLSGPIMRGGMKVAGGLHFYVPLPDDLFEPERLKSFREYLRRQPGGVLTGNPEKGSRRASSAELRELAGLSEERVPKGLTKCVWCSEWRGSCIDPELPDRLVKVLCKCSNCTCCARCGRPFAERRLDANYFDGERGRIIHVPGYLALDHVCTDSDHEEGL